jgi:hypothetical protein
MNDFTKKAAAHTMFVLKRGSKVQAIKLIRTHTGLGLKEAKAIADGLTPEDCREGELDELLTTIYCWLFQQFGTCEHNDAAPQGIMRRILTYKERDDRSETPGDAVDENVARVGK